MSEKIHPEKLAAIQKYGNLSEADIDALESQSGDTDEIMSRLTVDLVNALLGLEVNIEDVVAVSSMVPNRFTVSKDEYERFLAMKDMPGAELASALEDEYEKLS